MSQFVAEALVTLGAVYVGAGLAFAVAFVAVGVARVDRVAAEGTLGFRLILVPGCALLWPLLARRWVAGAGTPPESRDAHVDGSRRGGAR
jgi:hypothetical protein